MIWPSASGGAMCVTRATAAITALWNSGARPLRFVHHVEAVGNHARSNGLPSRAATAGRNPASSESGFGAGPHARARPRATARQPHERARFLRRAVAEGSDSGRPRVMFQRWTSRTPRADARRDQQVHRDPRSPSAWRSRNAARRGRAGLVTVHAAGDEDDRQVMAPVAAAVGDQRISVGRNPSRPYSDDVEARAEPSRAASTSLRSCAAASCERARRISPPSPKAFPGVPIGYGVPRRRMLPRCGARRTPLRFDWFLIPELSALGLPDTRHRQAAACPNRRLPADQVRKQVGPARF